ncbi:putative HTLV-1-related endogenous sequence [Corvus moneduloides]|uniref:putative HTLV-1-related endogenous sequence n=1 Tax=Corvus moneduloides TaxID=1196302 RepID=UPI0013631BBB|nr:putative HTLV-1-related endogenous sequence [Corvus moneduloides]
MVRRVRFKPLQGAKPKPLPRNRDASGVSQGERPPRRRHRDHPRLFPAPQPPRHNHHVPSTSERPPPPHVPVPVPLTRRAPAAPRLTLRSGRGFFSNPTNGSARRRAASWEDGPAAAQGSMGSVVPEGRGRLPRFALGRQPRPGGSERSGWLCRGCGAAATQGRCRHTGPSAPGPAVTAGARLPRKGALAPPGLPSPACGARTWPLSGAAEG